MKYTVNTIFIQLKVPNKGLLRIERVLELVGSYLKESLGQEGNHERGRGYQEIVADEEERGEVAEARGGTTYEEQGCVAYNG